MILIRCENFAKIQANEIREIRGYVGKRLSFDNTIMATGGDFGEIPEDRELISTEKVQRNLSDNRPMFIRHLRCTECLPSLTGVIDGFDQDFDLHVRRVRMMRGQEKANEIFLNKIEDSRDSEKWKIFINTLQQLDYEMLVRLLTGEPISNHREKYVKLVELLTPVMIHKMDPVALLPYLSLEGCLDERDIQNIERAARERGDTCATELLLSRVTRLKDDWFRGFMAALKRVGMTELMSEIDPDYTEKMLTQPEETFAMSETTPMSASVVDKAATCQTDVATEASSDCFESKEVSESKEKDEDVLVCAPGLSASPLRDYQREWYETVSTGQNTLLLGPRHSGKTFVTLKLIQDRLSRKDPARERVAYISTEQKKIMQMEGECRAFPRRPSMTVVLGKGPFSQHDFRRYSLLIMSGEACCSALSQEDIRFSDFSLVIVELDVDYFEEESHVYKKVMSHFHDLNGISPQILVLATSVCGNGKDWPRTDMMGVAMEVCADFDIRNIADVEKTAGSLKEVVNIPLVERTPVPERQNKEFSQTMEELMCRVENVMERKHASMGGKDYPVPEMVGLSKAPAGRTSVKYMAWLKTNKTTLSDLVDRHTNRSAKFFLRCIKLLQEKKALENNFSMLLQEALFIGTECCSVDGIKYVEKEMKQAVPGAGQTNPADPLKDLFAEIREKMETLKTKCLSDDYTDPMPQALKKKLTVLYADGRRPKVVILVKYPVAVQSVARYLNGVARNRCEGACAHDKVTEMSKDPENEFDVLVTTWPLLVYHFEGGPCHWDCIIRTDCPYNGFVAWEHEDETTPSSEVNLLLESSIETTTMEIIALQRNSSEEYASALRNIQTGQEERRLAKLNSEIEQALEESTMEFFCHGCGTFVCNACNIRKLDDLRICTDEKVIHKLKAIRHPKPTRLPKGYAKLGRFVCKQCGEKWGKIVSVLLHPHLDFSKTGLDVYDKGCFSPYVPEWNHCGVHCEQFHHNRDLLRCLPSTFCVEGEPVQDLLRHLPDVR